MRWHSGHCISASGLDVPSASGSNHAPQESFGQQTRLALCALSVACRSIEMSSGAIIRVKASMLTSCLQHRMGRREGSMIPVSIIRLMQGLHSRCWHSKRRMDASSKHTEHVPFSSRSDRSSLARDPILRRGYCCSVKSTAAAGRYQL